MSQKIYVVTKDKYLGSQRTLGFFRFLNNDLYYDFGLLDGSHYSYHKDGSQWRTSAVTDGKPVKEGEHIPLADFSGLFNLGTLCFSKRIIPKLPKVKKKYFSKYTALELDVESFSSEYINIVMELIEKGYDIPLPEGEKCLPPDAVEFIVDQTKPIVSLTVLGHDHNLLVIPNEKTITVNHFNERFTANKEGQQYSTENYSGEFLSGLREEKAS